MLNNELEKLIMLIWFGRGLRSQVGLSRLLTAILERMVAYGGKYGSGLAHN